MQDGTLVGNQVELVTMKAGARQAGAARSGPRSEPGTFFCVLYKLFNRLYNFVFFPLVLSVLQLLVFEVAFKGLLECPRPYQSVGRLSILSLLVVCGWWV